jgi:arylsulfatase A
LSIIRGRWKYIEPSNGPVINKNTNTELGNLNTPQLYDLGTDPGENNNVAEQYPEITKALKDLLEKVKKNN